MLHVHSRRRTVFYSFHLFPNPNSIVNLCSMNPSSFKECLEMILTYFFLRNISLGGDMCVNLITCSLLFCVWTMLSNGRTWDRKKLKEKGKKSKWRMCQRPSCAHSKYTLFTEKWITFKYIRSQCTAKVLLDVDKKFWIFRRGLQ